MEAGRKKGRGMPVDHVIRGRKQARRNSISGPRRGTRREAGISTLEVLAGLTVFALVATGSMVLSIGSMKATTTSRQATAASTLIYDKIDQLRALNPATNPADFAAGSHADPLNPLTENGETGGKFTRTWFVTEDSPAIGLSEVVVTVTWTDYSTRTARGTTYICRRAACT